MTAPVPSSLLKDLSTEIARIVAGAAGWVVAVHSHRSRSSGFVWRPGLIVTADEALPRKASSPSRFRRRDSAARKLVGRDPTTDVALLAHRPYGPAPAPLGAEPVAAGALAIAVGAEEGAPTAALGVVSRSGGPWRSLRGGEIDARIELDRAPCGAAPKAVSRSMPPAGRSA